MGIGALVLDGRGNFWLGGNAAILRWRPGDSQFYKIKALEPAFGTSGVNEAAIASDGSLWIGMQSAGPGLGLQHMVNGVLKPYRAPGFNSDNLRIYGLLIDRQNSIWIGTAGQGIYRIRGRDVEHYGSVDGLSADVAERPFEDREGDLWIATPKGVDMFRDLRVRSFSKSEGLSEDSVDAVLASRDGKIWLGNGEHIEALGPNGVPDTPKGAPKGNQSTYLVEDHLGRIWAGMDNTLWVFENGRFTQIRKQDGKPFGVVMGMTEDTDHNIWAETIGPPATLIRIRHMRIQEQIATPKLPLARKIVADAHTGIWLGLGTGDLARYRAGKLETFRFGETLKLKSVRYISSKQVDGSNHRAPKAC